MKVGIIGSGGREHAICQSIKNPTKLRKYFVLEIQAQKILQIM